VAGLMAAACNIMNAQTNSNIAGVVFDALTGSYILSLPETRVNEDVFMKVRMILENNESIPTLNKRLEKLETKKTAIKEKIIKRITKKSKDYVKSIMLSYIKKYESWYCYQCEECRE